MEVISNDVIKSNMRKERGRRSILGYVVGYRIK